MERPAERLAAPSVDWDDGGRNNGGRALPASVRVSPATPLGAVPAAACTAPLWCRVRRAICRSPLTALPSSAAAGYWEAHDK